MHTPLGSQNPPQSPLNTHNRGTVMQNDFDPQTKQLSLTILRVVPFRHSSRSLKYIMSSKQETE